MVIILGVIFSVGNCPGGSYPGWELSWVGIFLSGNISGDNFSGGSYPGWEFSGWELSSGNHPGGNFPGGSFPSPLLMLFEKILI